MVEWSAERLLKRTAPRLLDQVDYGKIVLC
jgi:hypothetical protein